MTARRRSRPTALALIAAPWQIYSRPSIQLGALKGYLSLRFSGLRIDAHHFYLRIAEAIGYRLYHAISERTWLAESVYAALLYPERMPEIDRFFRRQTAGNPLLRRTDLDELVVRVRQATDRWLGASGLDGCGLAGLTVSMCQLSASLYVLRRIKRLAPRVSCVVGGAAFSGIPTGPVFELFEEIDAVVKGEGELPLASLAKAHLLDGIPIKDLPPIDGLSTRCTPPAPPDAFGQMPSLEKLPPPQYDDYFASLASLPAERRFFATLPVELSRGCWWQRRRPEGGPSGCAFCNLNLQWRGYRQKSPSQAVSEIDYLTGRHQTLAVAFTDNVLPRKGAARMFDSLGDLGKDLRLFGEIRAETAAADLARMQAAGMNEVQIGIEALSGSLLRKLGKGVGVIDNLAVMKACEALGLRNASNLILLFPGSDRQDVEETLQALDFALPYRPLTPVDFWLGMGSPVWRSPAEFGIRSVFNHPHWGRLFPRRIARRFPFVVQGYRGDRGRQRRLWQPVRRAVREWQRTYHMLRAAPTAPPILSYRDGREFLMIRQGRPQAAPLTHRLTGESRRIYLFCGQPRPFEQIRSVFEGKSADEIHGFLSMLVAKRLMFAEKGRFLALAVPAAGHAVRHSCVPQ